MNSRILKTMFKLRFIILFLILTFCANHTLEAVGLTTGFSEVLIENLETGKTYTTSEAAGLPLVVVNTGEEVVDLKMELLLPREEELKEGFLPLPELSWIKLESLEFKEVKPNASAETDVIISIPDDQQYRGKKYQVFIWSHTTGRALGVGLKSKLLFTIR